MGPLFGPSFVKDRLCVLHGFTHGGVELLANRCDGTDIFANYADGEIDDVVDFVNLFPFLTALVVTEFLGFEPELECARQIFNEYLNSELVQA